MAPTMLADLFESIHQPQIKNGQFQDSTHYHPDFIILSVIESLKEKCEAMPNA